MVAREPHNTYILQFLNEPEVLKGTLQLSGISNRTMKTKPSLVLDHKDCNWKNQVVSS